MLQPLDDAQHYRLVHPRRLHVILDAVHGVDSHRRVAEGAYHILQHRRRNPVGPDMGMNVYAHQPFLIMKLPDLDIKLQDFATQQPDESG